MKYAIACTFFCIMGISMVAVEQGCGNPPTGTTPPPVNPINTGATITLQLAKGIRLVEDGIRTANANKLASDDVTATVLRLTVRINKAGLDADNVLRSQANNPKASARTLLAPLVIAIQSAINQDVIKITDPNTRNTVSSSLSALILTINGILAGLGGA